MAERGLSTTSTHSQAPPEIPLHHEPSPTKDLERPGAAVSSSPDGPAVRHISPCISLFHFLFPLSGRNPAPSSLHDRSA